MHLTGLENFIGDLSGLVIVVGAILRVTGKLFKKTTQLIDTIAIHTKAISTLGEKLDGHVSTVLANHEQRIIKLEGEE